MAQMFPSEPIYICNEVTEGERYLFYILKECLSDDNIVFYNLPVNGFYPDFTIIIPSIGLIVFEVKDWSIDYIVESNAYEYSVKKFGQVENPIIQAKAYMNHIQNELRNEKLLLQQFGKHKGKLKFPRATGVVFTNITQDEYLKSNHHRSIDPDCILFSDDLRIIEESRNTAYLLEKISIMFKHSFVFTPLTSSEMQCIRKLLNKESETEFSTADNSDSNISEISSSSIEELKQLFFDDLIEEPANESLGENEMRSKKEEENKVNEKLYKNNLIYPVFRIVKKTLFYICKYIIIAMAIIFVSVRIYMIFSNFKLPNISTILSAGKGYEEPIREQPTMTLMVGSYPNNTKGTYIYIKDGKKFLIDKVFKEGSIIEFYKDKTIIVKEAESQIKEYSIINDVVSLEVGNSYTKVYQGVTEYKNLKYFRYDFIKNEIIPIKK